MDLSVNSDFIKSTGEVSDPLRLIAEAGFEYLHWCHHWCGDFLYSASEIAKIARLLREYGLKLFDLHSSHGEEKCWCSLDESERLAGEELLLNRIRMTGELGGRAIVLHTNTAPLSDFTRARAEQGVRTLESLEPRCRELGVRIAIENLWDAGGESSFYDMERCLSRFPPDYVGICWDTGHSNMVRGARERIEALSGRLLVLHLNDNHGASDEHLAMGDGTVDWDAVARIVAASPYDGALTQEVNLPAGREPLAFLKDVRARGQRLAASIEALRAKGGGRAIPARGVV